MNESQWLIWARKLQAIAQNGLTTQYGSQDPVDRERYHEVQQVAAEITARHAALPVEEIIDLFDGPSRIRCAARQRSRRDLRRRPKYCSSGRTVTVSGRRREAMRR